MDLSLVKAIGNKDVIPMAATSGIHGLYKLLEEIDVNLSADRIEQTTAAFNAKQSLCTLDTCLSEVAAKMNSYLGDVHQYLHALEMDKTERREDFSAITTLEQEIDAIRERLVSIPFGITKFYEKHKDHLGETVPTKDPEQTMRKIAIRGHKTWLQYQVSFITMSIQSVTRYYKLVTGKN